MNVSFEHRRSVTVQQDVEQWHTLAGSKLKSTEAMSNWRRRRANTIDETNIFAKGSFHSLPPNPLRVKGQGGNTQTINKEMQSRLSVDYKMNSMPSGSNARPCRADKVDNWRVKARSNTNSQLPSRPIFVQHERRRSSTESLQPKNTETSSLSSLEEVEVPKEVPACNVEVLPPIRVSMDPGPIEVLPPLRFSMEPAIKGRSPWRFVLPSPKPDKTSKMKFSDTNAKVEEVEEGEITVDDLPHWLQGNKDDLIVRMGSSPLRRPSSPSQRSSSSFTSSQQDEPALDYGSGDDEYSSVSSSPSGSPDLTARELQFDPLEERTYQEDNMKTPLATRPEFALPSFTAAAPLPSHLPLPSFLLRR